LRQTFNISSRQHQWHGAQIWRHKNKRFLRYTPPKSVMFVMFLIKRSLTNYYFTLLENHINFVLFFRTNICSNFKRESRKYKILIILFRTWDWSYRIRESIRKNRIINDSTIILFLFIPVRPTVWHVWYHVIITLCITVHITYSLSSFSPEDIYQTFFD
jgi:hypothetical protein